MSALLIAPSAVTSSRKFPDEITAPDCDFVCAISAEFTFPSPVVSPIKIDIGIVTFVVDVPSEISLRAADFYYTNGEPAGLVKQFVDFTLSPDGQKIVANVGFVPMK